MKKVIFLILLLLPIIAISQDLTETSTINITKTWSQEPNGYTYPMIIHVPTGEVPENGFPVAILLHGNGGNGSGLVSKIESTLECHVLIAPTGYQNSWNLCAEKSDAPDIEMVNELVNILQDFPNVNSNRIRILGVSNGAGLANRVFIENTNPGIDIVCAIISQLYEPQHHLGNFYQPSSLTNPSSEYCGYDTQVKPLANRKYLSICNENDPVIPYKGGKSFVGASFLSAESATYQIAKNQGYNGSQLELGTSIGNPAIFEFSYLSGNVTHIKGNAGHSMNKVQIDYVKEFFSDCKITE
jgi:poly(3-hydroxybutyrate) depolymerase